MSLLNTPVLSALTPDKVLGKFGMPKGFEVPGSSDGSNPLYNRNLSVADRIAGAHEFFTKYCQTRRGEIELIADNTSKISALEDLRAVLEFVLALRTNGAEMIRKIDLPITVQALMGANMVGPDAKIFAGRDIGIVPVLPDNIVEILKSNCELANEGQTLLGLATGRRYREPVSNTHRLVLIPATIDGVPTSINSLRKFAEKVGKGRERAFRNQDWYDREEFSNRALAQSKWILMYGTMAPNTGSKNDAEQIEAIKGHKQYETVGALEAIGTLVLGYLEHKRRDFSDFWCRTEDRASSGARVGVGAFNSGGLDVYDSDNRDRDSGFGRAVCRKFP